MYLNMIKTLVQFFVIFGEILIKDGFFFVCWDNIWRTWHKSEHICSLPSTVDNVVLSRELFTLTAISIYFPACLFDNIISFLQYEYHWVCKIHSTCLTRQTWSWKTSPADQIFKITALDISEIEVITIQMGWNIRIFFNKSFIVHHAVLSPRLSRYNLTVVGSV